jgi:hypothetical protein
MNRERIDLNKKESWDIENARLIADHFGYVCDDNFIRALKEFGDEIVNARITLFLSALAHNFFRRVEPPLERKNKNK